jgi:hypothetical protein
MVTQIRLVISIVLSSSVFDGMVESAVLMVMLVMNRALFNFELIQSEMLYLFLKLIARIYLFKNAFHLGNLMHNVA